LNVQAVRQLTNLELRVGAQQVNRFDLFRTDSARDRSILVLTGTFIITPYALTYDMGLFAAAVGLMATRDKSTWPEQKERILILTLAMLLPILMIPVGTIGGPLAPIIVPTIILSVAVYGVFAKLKLIGAWYGLVVAHTVLALPFVVLVMAAGLRDFDRSLEQAAEGLGASRWRTLTRVTLPLLRPSLVSAGLLAFISSFDEVVVALFLAGTNMTLPKKMFDNILMEIDPTIAAVSVMQILLVSMVMVLIGRFGRGLKDSAR